MKIPKGWKLVPLVPTEKMMKKAETVYFSGCTGTQTAAPDDVWKAMVSAAPKAPTT